MGTRGEEEAVKPTLRVDPEQFAQRYGHVPMRVEHDLVGNPLLTHDALVALAAELPIEHIEHNIGDVPPVLVGEEAPRLAASPTEVARDIAHNGAWMVLKYVQQVPRYGTLVDELLDQIEPLPDGQPMGHREAYVFLSGASTMTPAHRDPEHNFLLHVQGEKQFTLGARPAGDEIRHLEHAYRYGQRNFPTMPQDSETFDLQPGTGLYVPPDAVHAVRNGAAVSISLSIVWRPAAVVREGRVLRFNHTLRRLGVTPKPPGVSPRADRVKAVMVWASLAVRRILSRLRRTPSG
jgi:Cupin superfamily protein